MIQCETCSKWCEKSEISYDPAVGLNICSECLEEAYDENQEAKEEFYKVFYETDTFF